MRHLSNGFALSLASDKVKLYPDFLSLFTPSVRRISPYRDGFHGNPMLLTHTTIVPYLAD